MQPVQLDSSIPAGKLESRIDGAAGKLGVKINEAFPVVLSDSSKVEELHRLRKDCKKLRYILEMVPPAGRKKYERAVSLALVLEELQDLLGAIRDSDITIEYLQGSRSKIARELAAREAGNRDRLYRDLVRRAKQATTTPLRRVR
jgi:CHAD domain-containing protein